MHLGHVAYHVRDINRTLDFYCKRLGFTELFAMCNDAGDPSMVYVKINEREFLEFFPSKEARGNDSSFSHLCLHTDDIEKELAELNARGVKADGPITKGKAGSLQAWLTDPDGNRIELMQLTPESKHLAAGN